MDEMTTEAKRKGFLIHLSSSDNVEKMSIYIQKHIRNIDVNRRAITH